MTTLTLDQAANDCGLLYRLVGIARMGARPASGVSELAHVRLQALAGSGALGADAAASVQVVLKTLREGATARESECCVAMDKLHQVRLPLLRERRERDAGVAAASDRPPRERG